MKKNLEEEIYRIHELTYGQSILKEESFLDKIKGFFKKHDDPKKSDIIGSQPNEFYQSLEDAAKSGGVSRDDPKNYTFKKEAETLQIALLLLGYKLPVHGVDGLYGPETANAVSSFIIDNIDSKMETSGETADEEVFNKLLELTKQKNITSDDLKMYVDPVVSFDGLKEETFYEKLLENLNAPVSEENLKFLYAWRQSEGGKARYNPFNTTQSWRGATNYNEVGVKNYLSIEDGLAATLKTLRNGRYNCIVNGLRDDIGADKISTCYNDLQTWGTGNLVNTVVSRYNRGDSPNVPRIMGV